jgi:hypothetical protein
MSAQCKVCGGEFPCDNHDPCDSCGKVVSVWFAHWFGDTMLCKECNSKLSSGTLLKEVARGV